MFPVSIGHSMINRSHASAWNPKQRVDSNRWRMVSSGMAEIEIDAIPDPERRRRMLAILPGEQDRIPLTPEIMERAMEIQMLGLKAADAVHLAAAEATGADVFLTCDDRLVRVGVRKKLSLRVRVMNPLTFLEEQGDAPNT